MLQLASLYRNFKVETFYKVSALHKMVQKCYEEDRLQARPQHDSALKTLSPKMTELLDELAMVEKEISRLENQIILLKAEPEHNERVHTQPALQEWELANQRSVQQEAPLAHDPCNISKRSNEKVTSFEMKALHFITKAIKGDYKLSDFTLNDKAINSKRFKENTVNDQKPSKRGPLLRRPSPSRHPTPKALVMSTPLHPEEDSIHKWSPNKLSENIMRCLIFIYLRLLQTSRTVELEKPIARSTDFSLSFRAETSSAGLVFPKDSRQQDPYGIFDSKESLIRDIGPYKNLVRFTSTSMDLKCIQNSASIPLFQKLKTLMDGLEKVDLRFLSHRQKLAFWINMYNACIMHGYLQYGISSTSSPEKMLKLINQATHNIAGNSINAQTIERSILRKPVNSQEKLILGGKEMMLHDLYGLKSSDPNIIFALCCATHSSPAVKIYTAEGVTGELQRSKLEYLQASIVVTSTKKIALPELLLRNMFDFGQDMGSLVEWLCQQLPASGSLRKSIVDCFKQVNGGRASAVVEMLPYDFEFQYLFSV
ncbi:uncharacterized protein LOC121795687 isoform X2 [Salvia splendens]|uniref:uncharacterized protein LOC121795687 isoform X2 n=1 Tax=Salvia splendens TaxID=180675 RepID=UPI001C2803E9|nr:uncharacterized protein LOC121795687 isoform X2 [Salvia splendens]